MGFNPIAGILKRRLLIVFLAVALLVAGVLSFRELPLQAYPGVAPLSVQAITQWPGRSTTEVEQQITIPIENALAGVPDVQSFRSVSLFGLSVVTLKFKEGTDSFKARQNFSQYLASANLPTGVQSSLSPDSDATGEIMRFRLEGDGVDLTTLKSYQDYDISKGLKHVQGVASASRMACRLAMRASMVASFSRSNAVTAATVSGCCHTCAMPSLISASVKPSCWAVRTYCTSSTISGG